MTVLKTGCCALSGYIGKKLPGSVRYFVQAVKMECPPADKPGPGSPAGGKSWNCIRFN